jgi:hypothetical protein
MLFELFLNVLAADLAWQVANPDTHRRRAMLILSVFTFAISFGSFP